LDNWAWFEQEADKLGITLPGRAAEAFRHFHSALLTANQTMNLTRIVSERDAIIKHYLDALYFLKLVPAPLDAQALRLLDLGTGAGIPGIPLLIARPQWQGVLVDAVGKKVAFVNDCLAQLSLCGSVAIHERSEVLSHLAAHREQYDLVVARAVAATPELIELTVPFLKLGGYLILSKGQKGAEELHAAQKALTLLGAEVDHSIVLELPDELGQRHLTRIIKRHPTPRHYPRSVGLPHRKPLR
jgi:16S rRNA (guanine527-N7)-methyltransferase